MSEQVLLLRVSNGDIHVSNLHSGHFLGSVLWDLMASLNYLVPEAAKRPHLLSSLSGLCPFLIISLRFLPKLHASVPVKCLPDRAAP